ncbi:MAG: hypothetical protein IJ795_08105 [Bacteroidales bacterium]|nr:hypothetical protein [Bacteroidales bacterium]
MKRYFIITFLAALAVISCGKDNGSKDGNVPAGLDENGLSSLLIREKGKSEFAKEIDITVGVKESTFIEVKPDPETAAVTPRFESGESTIAYATQQGTVRGRKAGQTKITVSVNGTVYATANVTVVDGDNSSDPGPAPSEKIRLDDSHWFFYCVCCDEYEPIKEASAHAAANHYATWYPYTMNIVLMEDTEDMWSYLAYEDDEGNYTYSYTVGPDTYYKFEDEDCGDGIFFDLDPTAPYPQIYSSGVLDPFCHGSLTVSFENERYIAGPYTCDAQYRGLIGYTPEVDINIVDSNDYSVIMRSLIHNNQTELHPRKGGVFKALVTWPAFEGGAEKGSYAHRDFAETGYDYFYVTSSNPDVVSVESMGNAEGERWEATFKCNSVGSADLQFNSHVSQGVSSPVWTNHVNVRE